MANITKKKVFGIPLVVLLIVGVALFYLNQPKDYSSSSTLAIAGGSASCIGTDYGSNCLDCVNNPTQKLTKTCKIPNTNNYCLGGGTDVRYFYDNKCQPAPKSTVGSCPNFNQFPDCNEGSPDAPQSQECKIASTKYTGYQGTSYAGCTLYLAICPKGDYVYKTTTSSPTMTCNKISYDASRPAYQYDLASNPEDEECKGKTLSQIFDAHCVGTTRYFSTCTNTGVLLVDSVNQPNNPVCDGTGTQDPKELPAKDSYVGCQLDCKNTYQGQLQFYKSGWNAFFRSIPFIGSFQLSQGKGDYNSCLAVCREIYNESKDYTSIIITVVLVLILIIILWFIFFKRRRKR